MLAELTFISSKVFSWDWLYNCIYSASCSFYKKEPPNLCTCIQFKGPFLIFGQHHLSILSQRRQNLLEHTLQPWGHGRNHAALCRLSCWCSGAARRSKHLFHWVSQMRTHSYTYTHVDPGCVSHRLRPLTWQVKSSRRMYLMQPNLTNVLLGRVFISLTFAFVSGLWLTLTIL